MSFGVLPGIGNPGGMVKDRRGALPLIDTRIRFDGCGSVVLPAQTVARNQAQS